MKLVRGVNFPLTILGKENWCGGWSFFFAAGRMLTPQEQEVKFRLTQSHNQTWQKDWGGGGGQH